eukprot:gene17751-21147_t
MKLDDIKLSSLSRLTINGCSEPSELPDPVLVINNYELRISPNTTRATYNVNHESFRSDASYDHDIFRLFVDENDVPLEVLEDIMINKAFKRFGSSEVVEVKNVCPKEHANFNICELWHGPTLAFKDLGLQILGQLLQYFLAQDRQNLLLLVGTSGDTGAATLLRGLVMAASLDTGAATLLRGLVIAASLDTGAATLLRGLVIAASLDTGSAAIEAVKGLNNVDIMVLYPLKEYANISLVQELQMTSCNRERNVDVLAVEGTSDDLDVPMEILFRSTGTLQKSGAVAQTNSPSMDIQVPYNIERLMYIMTAGDSRQVIAWMNEFKATGRLGLSWEEMRPLRDLGLTSAMATSSRVLEVISAVQCRGGYMLDPHTAVGVAAFLDAPPSQGPSVCMACAHPMKFAETVAAAFQVSVDVANHMMPDAKVKWALSGIRLQRQRGIVRHPVSVMCDESVRHPVSVMYDEIVRHPVSVMCGEIVRHPVSVMYDEIVRHPVSVMYEEIVRHPDHPSVSRVFQLLRDHGTVSTGSLPCQVLRRGEDWAMSLRKLIATIETRRLQPKM